MLRLFADGTASVARHRGGVPVRPRCGGNAYELFSLAAGLFAAMWPLSGMAFTNQRAVVCQIFAIACGPPFRATQ